MSFAPFSNDYGISEMLRDI